MPAEREMAGEIGAGVEKVRVVRVVNDQEPPTGALTAQGALDKLLKVRFFVIDPVNILWLSYKPCHRRAHIPNRYS